MRWTDAHSVLSTPGTLCLAAHLFFQHQCRKSNVADKLNATQRCQNGLCCIPCVSTNQCVGWHRHAGNLLSKLLALQALQAVPARPVTLTVHRQLTKASLTKSVKHGQIAKA
jgi:hypothetical protein